MFKGFCSPVQCTADLPGSPIREATESWEPRMSNSGSEHHLVSTVVKIGLSRSLAANKVVDIMCLGSTVAVDYCPPKALTIGRLCRLQSYGTVVQKQNNGYGVMAKLERSYGRVMAALSQKRPRDCGLNKRLSTGLGEQPKKRVFLVSGSTDDRCQGRPSAQWCNNNYFLSCFLQ